MVFPRKTDLRQDINYVILLFLPQNHHFLGYKLCKYSNSTWILSRTRCCCTAAR